MQLAKNEFEILHAIASSEDQTETGEDIIGAEVWVAFSRHQKPAVKSCLNKGYIRTTDMYSQNMLAITAEGYKAYTNALIDLANLIA